MKRLLHKEVSAGDALPTLEMEVTSTQVIAGALASRDHSPLHHDYKYATEQAGHKDIFINTFHQASLFERFLGDWAGPRGRLGKLGFKMSASVYAGDKLSVTGTVTETSVDEQGCGWLDLDLAINVGDLTCTACKARYALPVDNEDNPWTRRGEDWQP